MITVEKARDTNGVILSGDFFDFDRLYFAIMKFTGSHGLNDECPFPGCHDTCENLLGLCYELRRAWQGQRSLKEVYNGVSNEWFKDRSFESDKYDDEDSDDDFDDDDTENDANREKIVHFSRSEFPNVNENNTYFSTTLTFPEIVFYAFITSDLLKKKDFFLLSRKRMAEEKGAMQGLYKEYYFFGAEEDLARITLFTNHALHTLYRFIGEEKYVVLMSRFREIKDFSATCDLRKINDLLVDYGEKEYAQDDPDTLASTLMAFLG